MGCKIKIIIQRNPTKKARFYVYFEMKPCGGAPTKWHAAEIKKGIIIIYSSVCLAAASSSAFEISCFLLLSFLPSSHLCKYSKI